MNAAYRLKFASASGWRRMNHSTSFRAAGSPIVFCTAVASLVLALRARSIASLTAARSAESGEASATRRRHVAGPRRFALRGRDMLCMRGFLQRRWVVPRSGRLMRLLGLLRLMAGPCDASVEHTASTAKVRKQDSGRKRWFIPWSPRTNRTNHDSYGWSCPEGTTAPIRNCRVSATARENKSMSLRARGPNRFDDRLTPTPKSLAIAKFRSCNSAKSAKCRTLNLPS